MGNKIKKIGKALSESFVNSQDNTDPKWKTFGISVTPEQYDWIQQKIKGNYTVSEYFRTLIRKAMEKDVVSPQYDGCDK